MKYSLYRKYLAQCERHLFTPIINNWKEQWYSKINDKKKVSENSCDLFF